MTESKMTIQQLQETIKSLYFKKDSDRGIEGTFVWFVEEVGELAKTLRAKDRVGLEEEFADVFAWLVSLANLCQVDLEEVVAKYSTACPKCKKIPCQCP